jgi:DNA repair protein SbcD/Mre11
MTQRPFRFLHAADLHLDKPAAGVADAPGQLVDLLVDCPLLAGRRVFDAAIEHHVDFVVLSGDIVDLNRAGPRAMASLVEQFERLAAKDIAIYWAGGTIDSADWPIHHTLPANVRHASRLHVQRHRHEIAGEAVCELVGRSHEHQEAPKAHEFANSREDLFSIAVVHTPFAGGMRDLGIDYWALGGLQGRSTLHQSAKSLSHYPGSPQGRSFNETGAHGCTLVQVDESRQVRLTPIATDVVRWESQSLTLGVAADRAELERLLRDRTTQLLAEAGGAALFIEWQIACDGTIFADLRRGKLTAELLATLQREFGNRTPAAWTVAIRPELPTELPTAWLREEKLRGDYLRAIGGLLHETQSSDGNLSPLDLDQILTHAGAGANLQRFDRLSALLADPAKRRRVLSEAAWLGADLLSAEEAAR